MQNGAAMLKNSLGVPRKIKYKVTISTQQLASRFIPKKIKKIALTETCTWMLIVTLFIIAKI